jgi:flagella basal body P-ring formation protein FlgA
MKILLILLLITNLFSFEKVENLIKQKYKETFPSIEIKNIKITNFSNKEIKNINSIDTRLLNPKKVNGTIIINKNIYLRYQIEAFIYVVKTTKTLKRNSNITLSNTKVAKIKLLNLVSFPIKPTNIGELSVKNYTPKDKILYDYNVRKEILIKRGEIVKVVSKNPEIEVTFQAKALNDGGKGETINIEINKAKRSGKVIGKQLVEME